jgi:histone H4
MDDITRNDIIRIANRGGVKRVSGLTYEEVRGVTRNFLEKVLRDAVLFMEHSKRKTISSEDIKHALERNGRKLYS